MDTVEQNSLICVIKLLIISTNQSPIQTSEYDNRIKPLELVYPVINLNPTLMNVENFISVSVSIVINIG